MKTWFLILLGLVLSSSMYATWQVANPYQGHPVQEGLNPRLGRTDYPDQYLDHSSYSIFLMKGSLRDNVERIAEQYQWKVQWKVTKDYSVLIHDRVSGVTFPLMLSRVLDHYPVQAVYDEVSHIVIIQDQRMRVK